MAEIVTQSKLDGRTKQARRLKADARRRQEIANGLLADLGRPVNTTDEVWAANLASMVVRAELLEAAGMDSSELRQRINQGMRTAGRKLAPAGPQKPADPSANAVEWLNSFKKPSSPSEAPA
jgi:hypothetical protein